MQEQSCSNNKYNFYRRILRVFFVAIDGVVGGGLARLAFDTVCCRNLFGLVTQIPFVHDIEKGRKLAAVLFLACLLYTSRISPS